MQILTGTWPRQILKETRLQNVNRSEEMGKLFEQLKPNMKPNTFNKTKLRNQNFKVLLFNINQVLIFDNVRMIFLPFCIKSFGNKMKENFFTWLSMRFFNFFGRRSSSLASNEGTSFCKNGVPLLWQVGPITKIKQLICLCCCQEKCGYPLWPSAIDRTYYCSLAGY